MKYVLMVLMVVGYALAGCSHKSDSSDVAPVSIESYYCPMHPEVTSDRPGVCPICNMELVKQTGETDESVRGTPGILTMSAEKQVLANVSTVKIRKERLIKKLVSYSYLDFAEDKRRVISARFSGRIERVYVANTGESVNKGQPLFEIYSPELVEAQQEYLIARDKTVSGSAGAVSESGSGGNSLVNSAKKRLELYGLTSDQVHRLEASGEAQYTLTFYSPIGGTVIDKKIQEGVYVNEGALLYEMADLSSLWSIAEVYEKDLPLIRTGGKVVLRFLAYPGEEFAGVVSLIYPVVNSVTRTVKVRSEVANVNNKLRPQMFGETIVQQDLGEQLLIPQDAVMFTGKREIVWIKTNENTFEARKVTLGVKNDGKYQVLSGLKEGDEVAVTGGFLIDSESQLKGGQTSGGTRE